MHTNRSRLNPDRRGLFDGGRSRSQVRRRSRQSWAGWRHETQEPNSALTMLLNTILLDAYGDHIEMTETSSRDLFPGALEMMILESLRRQPAHGYALVQHIQQRSNNLLQVEEGSLYPALQRLLKAKLVKAEWGISSTNRRVRTYQITASGLRHLEKQISSFERMFEGIALVLDPENSPASS